ncbi:WD40 repeat domain-containing protein [Armatimonas sp.]|uniref:WD40 repeat domain-containing protein n=1 Tax=Armatimonas sp. TaxID=1872638 RepID=UPI0037511F2F
MDRDNRERLLYRGLGIAGALLTVATSCYSFIQYQSLHASGGWGAVGLVFTPDGKRIIGAVSNYQSEYVTKKELWIWDAQTGKRLSQRPRTDDGSLTSLQFSPSGRYLLYRGSLYDTQKATPSFVLPDSGFQFVFSPDEKRILVRSSEVSVWDIASQKMLWQRRYPSKNLLETITLPKQGSLVLRYSDRSELWTTTSPKPQRFPRGHRFSGAGESLQRSQNQSEDRLLTVSRWGSAVKHEPIGRILDSRTGKTLVTLEGTTGW